MVGVIIMKVTILKKVYQEIIDHCRQQFPIEACGLIAGHHKSNMAKEILKAYMVRNASESRTYFIIDPKDQLKAVLSMRKDGLTPLGNFHSHPTTSAAPSDEDLRLGLDHRASYLIISLAERLPILKSYHVTKVEGENIATEDEVEII
jgi:proteasome lid subunit RPN8/RPN11